MRKALGATREDECRLGVHKIANVSLIYHTSLRALKDTFRVIRANFSCYCYFCSYSY